MQESWGIVVYTSGRIGASPQVGGELLPMTNLLVFTRAFRLESISVPKLSRPCLKRIKPYRISAIGTGCCKPIVRPC